MLPIGVVVPLMLPFVGYGDGGIRSETVPLGEVTLNANIVLGISVKLYAGVTLSVLVSLPRIAITLEVYGVESLSAISGALNVYMNPPVLLVAIPVLVTVVSLLALSYVYEYVTFADELEVNPVPVTFIGVPAPPDVGLMLMLGRMISCAVDVATGADEPKKPFM